MACISNQCFFAEMCPELTIPHGFVKPKGLTPFNLMVSVTCEDGYTLKGSALQTCVEHGQWAGVLPECTGTDDTYTKNSYNKASIIQ